MIFIKDVITSRSNPFVKWAASLTEKKGRNAAECFLAEGVKLSFEALEARLPVTHIIVREDARASAFSKLSDYENLEIYKDTEVVVVSAGVFEKISTEKAPQGVITVIKYLDFFSEMDIIYKEEFLLPRDERAILLCSVRDPSNLGAVIRSAVAFGTDHVILSDDCADIYNPKTVRSAMGSLFRVKATVIKDLNSFISSAKANGRRVFAAELSDGAIPITDLKLTSSDIVVIGNEGHGIPKEVSSECSASVYLPISHKTESLNASVAAAVFMWEQSKK